MRSKTNINKGRPRALILESVELCQVEAQPLAPPWLAKFSKFGL